jgi:hypothetical protein
MILAAPAQPDHGDSDTIVGAQNPGRLHGSRNGRCGQEISSVDFHVDLLKSAP